MSEIVVETFDDPVDPDIQRMIAVTEQLKKRCTNAGVDFEILEDDDEESENGIQIKFKNGRQVRPLSFWSPRSVEKLLSFEFEKYIFLGDLDAICSYKDGTIEAGIRILGTSFAPIKTVLSRIMNIETTGNVDPESIQIMVPSNQDGLPDVEISLASPEYTVLTRPISVKFSIKIRNCHISNHDLALELLQKIAGSLFLQIDLINGTALTLDRKRKFLRKNRKASTKVEIEYPRTQYEKAPLALYNYARSAAGMPLLQFLAFYQVMEFYFTIYSQSEAHRRIKTLLKDPAFRINQDADISRLLATIQSTKSGGFGDERTQLKATLMECTDADSIRNFLEADPERKEFFLGKSKYHKIPMSNATLDLRGDVAERIYDIRCKIVHTKSDSRDGAIELLLPFTREAEQLAYDIDLVQFIAQRVLIAGSSPLNLHN